MKIIKWLEILKTYLRNRKDINDYYGYALHCGFQQDDTLNWQGRIDYWLGSFDESANDEYYSEEEIAASR